MAIRQILSKEKELFKWSAVHFFIKTLGIFFSYLLTFLIARNYGPSVVGLFALALAVLNILAVFGKFGLDTTQLRLVSRNAANENQKGLIMGGYYKAIAIAIPLCMALSAALYVYSPYLAETVFDKIDMTQYLKLTAICILPFSLIAIHAESLRGLKKIFHYSILNDSLVPFMCVFILATLLLYTGSNNAPIVAYTISVIIVSIMGAFFWFKYSKEYRGANQKGDIKWSTLLSLALPLFLTSFSLMIFSWADKFMLGLFVTEREIGIYNVAFKISQITIIFLMSINSIAAPKFSNCHEKGDMAGLEKTAKNSTKLLFFASTPVLLIVFLAPEGILRLFGHSFEAGRTSLLLLTFGQFINSIAGSVGLLLIMTGKEKVFTGIMLCSTAINIALNAYLIPRFGINGAAFATALGVIMANIIPVIYIKRIYGFYTFAFYAKKHSKVC